MCIIGVKGIYPRSKSIKKLGKTHNLCIKNKQRHYGLKHKLCVLISETQDY